ncbi:MAG: 30S ribosomal protein S7 [Pseudomonadota bacterium]|nr:30S ribosomal protein S7 [Pseudomonadota bacterium]
MSRRHAAQKRHVLPDAKFGDIVLTKLINTMMYSGKKSAAETIAYEALDIIKKKTSADPLKFFHDALSNIKPSIEVRSRRVGGATYQVPTEVREERRLALALRWLIEAARARKEKTMRDRIANELMDAANGRGGAVTKRENTHKMAEANKAFSHYRW